MTRDNVKIIDQIFECNGKETPFGNRWGGEVLTLSKDHIDALLNGKTLALDVQSEYVVFLKGRDHE